MTNIDIFFLIGAAVIDSINPCAFGVLIFMLSYLAKTAKHKMLYHGSVYILAVFITYLVAGWLLLPVIRQFAIWSVYFYYIIAAIIFLAGLIELKDFFWYGKGISLSIFPSEARRIKAYVKHVSEKTSSAFALGVFVALVELPCTGFMYLAVLTLMQRAGLNIENFSLLVLYNVIFVLPLFVILFAVASGKELKEIEAWRHKHKHLMRLLIGLALVILAVWMVYLVA